jgi:hypothetical protein
MKRFLYSLSLFLSRLASLFSHAGELHHARFARVHELSDILTCSGSTTVGVGLANGGRFGLTLCDNDLGGRLTLSANGLRLADNGLDNSAPGSRLLTI